MYQKNKNNGGGRKKAQFTTKSLSAPKQRLPLTGQKTDNRFFIRNAI